MPSAGPATAARRASTAQGRGGLTIVSEPIDGQTRGLARGAEGLHVVARAGRSLAIECLNEAMARAA